MGHVPQKEILINYKGLQGRLVQLYVGFYQSQKEGDLIHSPKNCMPGAGWNIVQTSIEELNVDSNPEKVKMIQLILQKGVQKQIVLYWFQSRGRYISSEYMQKIYMVIDSIRKRRTDGSFVRLIAPVIHNEEETLENLKAFANLLIPKLQEYLPS
ncbi:MAG: EpsI family protein [Deltaproteobacteria bacterium]|nr:EpsI family protein [Deltaproteobacteria bacterium]